MIARRLVFSALILAFGFILVQSAIASDPLSEVAAALPVKQLFQNHSGTELLNDTVRTAISPLLVLVIKLAYQSDNETTRALLIVLGVFLLLIMCKDLLPVSLIKKPLDATEELTSFLPAVMGLISILPGLMKILAPPAAETVQLILDGLGPAQAYAADGSNQVVPGVSVLAQWIGGALVATAGTITYIAVWLLSNTLTILCMLVPASLGPVVKSCRLSVLGFLYALSQYHPFLALLCSIAIIIVALWVCRRTFNLTVWGGIYSFDLLTLAWRKHKPTAQPLAFVSGEGQKLLKVAKRTMGRLSMEDGRLMFRYRLFLLFPRTIELPTSNQMLLGRRITAPQLLQRVDERLVPLLTFRLACRTHEETLSRLFGGLGVVDVGLSRWFRNAWAWMDDGMKNTAKDTAKT